MVQSKLHCQLQLRNAETAEDLVQDAIEAALRHPSSFAGQSTLKTWVFAILRNRIIDHLRQAARTVPMSGLVDDTDDWQEHLETLFSERGGWREGTRPVAWPNPEESMRTRQFWAVFEACLDHLPANTGRVFMMREFLGFDSDEICQQLAISTGNCHVILKRHGSAIARLARMAYFMLTRGKELSRRGSRTAKNTAPAFQRRPQVPRRSLQLQSSPASLAGSIGRA